MAHDHDIVDQPIESGGGSFLKWGFAFGLICAAFYAANLYVTPQPIVFKPVIVMHQPESASTSPCSQVKGCIATSAGLQTCTINELSSTTTTHQ